MAVVMLSPLTILYVLEESPRLSTAPVTVTGKLFQMDESLEYWALMVAVPFPTAVRRAALPESAVTLTAELFEDVNVTLPCE